MSGFNVGETYPLRADGSRKVIAIDIHGRLIVESAKGDISFRSPNGRLYADRWSGADLVPLPKTVVSERHIKLSVLGKYAAFAGPDAEPNVRFTFTDDVLTGVELIK